MKISAAVVSYNEAELLDHCLANLKVCDQLLVVDLGSIDNSVEVARRYTSEVIFHEHQPVVENILPDILENLRNDWFIRADPDEVYPAELLKHIEECIEDPQLAIIKIPFQYYFLGRPLSTTVWGGIRYFPKVLNKRHITITKRVHNEPEIENGYQIGQIPHNGRNAVKHYWITSWSQLYEKHWRYLQFEGKSQYENGQRFTGRKLLAAVFKALAFNLIKYNGWRGGFSGIFLSFFHAWYVGMSWFSLRQYEKQVMAA